MKKTVFILILSAILCIMSVIVHGVGIANVNATGYSEIVIEQSSGRVLYSNDADRKRSMASTTKIVTAITAIENYKGDMHDIVEVPAEAVGIEGSSLYLKRGEKLEFIDLMYGLMLRSGNDCAVSVAILTGGSVAKFADMMNETAKKAGAVSSHFVNPHGLHDDDHYTTAADLALITAYAMRNDLFREIVSAKKYVTHRSGDAEQTIYNKNKLLSSYEGACGVKTGYTIKAGRCLVSAATRGGMTVIAVVLNCGPMFEECARLMDKAFENYEMKNLVPEGVLSYCKDENGKLIALKACGELLYPVKKGVFEPAEYIISNVGLVPKNAESGFENGKLDIYFDKQLLFSVKLVTI